MSYQEALSVLTSYQEADGPEELLAILKRATRLVNKDIKKKENGCRDKWSTPFPVYTQLCNQFQIYPTIDACADQLNTKCSFYITEEMDSLSIDWVEFAYDLGVEPIYFMNPPYSNTGTWVEKAYRESLQGAQVLFLLPNDTSTNWWQTYIKPLPEDQKDFPSGRIKFEPPSGIKPSTPRAGNCVGVFR